MGPRLPGKGSPGEDGHTPSGDVAGDADALLRGAWPGAGREGGAASPAQAPRSLRAHNAARAPRCGHYPASPASQPAAAAAHLVAPATVLTNREVSGSLVSRGRTGASCPSGPARGPGTPSVSRAAATRTQPAPRATPAPRPRPRQRAAAEAAEGGARAERRGARGPGRPGRGRGGALGFEGVREGRCAGGSIPRGESSVGSWSLRGSEKGAALEAQA